MSDDFFEAIETVPVHKLPYVWTCKKEHQINVLLGLKNKWHILRRLKNLKKISHLFWRYCVNVKTSGRFFQIFRASQKISTLCANSFNLAFNWSYLCFDFVSRFFQILWPSQKTSTFCTNYLKLGLQLIVPVLWFCIRVLTRSIG